jgi:hypothetical protein
MNSSGDITKYVVPSRHDVFSISTARPAALHRRESPGRTRSSRPLELVCGC